MSCLAPHSALSLYGMSGEVCWHEGEGCGERNGGSVLGCGAPTHFPTSSHSPHLSLHLPHTPTHFATPLVPLPTSPLPPPTPQHTFLLLLPHLPHLLKVWRSYHVTKFLWQSFHVAKLLATLWSGSTMTVLLLGQCTTNTEYSVILIFSVAHQLQSALCRLPVRLSVTSIPRLGREEDRVT